MLVVYHIFHILCSLSNIWYCNFLLSLALFSRKFMLISAFSRPQVCGRFFEYLPNDIYEVVPVIAMRAYNGARSVATLS